MAQTNIRRVGLGLPILSAAIVLVLLLSPVAAIDDIDLGLSASTRSRQLVVVGDINWYNNNERLVQQSRQFVDKLRQQIVNIGQRPQLPGLFSNTVQKYRCEPEINSCIPLLVQQHVDGWQAFNRTWKDFKIGFNDTVGNYWIGNELLHVLTKDGKYKIRFDLQPKATPTIWQWVEYQTFVVFSESTQYELAVDGYAGTGGYDALKYVNRMKFTTWDVDNDNNPDNCAKLNLGGFWYNNNVCGYCNVNSVYGRAEGFRWHGVPGSLNNGELKTSRMWLLCQQ